MSTKALLTLSASVLLSAAAFSPSAALAQLPGPPPGPPPMLAGPPPGLGAGGPPPGLAGGPPLGGPPAGLAAGLPTRSIAGAPRLDGAAGLRGLDRGGQANFRGVEARAAANYSANSYTRNSYASEGYGHGYRYGRYAAAAAYAYGRSYASSDDGCTYVSAYRRYGYRRVLVCHGD